MTEPISSIIKRIGRLNAGLDLINEQVKAARDELFGVLEDITAELEERGKIIDRIDAGLKEGLKKAEELPLGSKIDPGFKQRFPDLYK